MKALTPWWADAVVSQLYVRSFSDSNGDGIGDLPGITARLAHLTDVGVDAIWLNPVYPSPQKDHGYDVADYRGVDPDYGTLADLDDLFAAAHERGLRVLMDIVPNHSSNQHTWFQRALKSSPGSPERDWFYFRDGRGPDGTQPPNNWQSWFGGPAWTRITENDGRAGQWYLHLFTPEQPDINWSCSAVGDAFDEIFRFWWDRGAAGFRIDAPVVVGKTPGLPDAPPVAPGTPITDIAAQNPHVYHRPEVHDLFRRWRAVADNYEQIHAGRELVFVGETFSPSFDLVASYVNEDELHTTFSFALLLANWQAPRWQHAIEEALTGPHAHAGMRLSWALNNHDAQRNVSRYGHADARHDSSYTNNNLVNSDQPVDVIVGTRRARAAILIAAALPGPLYLYAGEELGLPEVLDLPDAALQDPIWERSGHTQRGRDGCRVPLPWAPDLATNYGFSMRGAAAPWMPQPTGWGTWAADTERGDPASMLSLYRDVLALRRTLATATTVDMVDLGSDVVAYRRDDVTVMCNMGDAVLSMPAEFGEVMIASERVQGRELTSDHAVWLRR